MLKFINIMYSKLYELMIPQEGTDDYDVKKYFYRIN